MNSDGRVALLLKRWKNVANWKRRNTMITDSYTREWDKARLSKEVSHLLSVCNDLGFGLSVGTNIYLKMNGRVVKVFKTIEGATNYLDNRKKIKLKLQEQ